MKQRVITALIAATVFIGGIICMFTPIYALMVALISGIAAFELTKATKVKNKILTISSIVIASALPFFFYYKNNLPSIPLFPVVTVVMILFLIIMVLNFNKTSIEDVLICFTSALIVPSAFSSMILISQLYITYPDKYTKTNCVFYILFAIFCAWMSDIFAYFVGRKLGKHKLAPTVSPKKSIEGAIGGVLGAVVLNVLLLTVFNKFFFTNNSITYGEIIILSVILSIISIFGDLSASVIKRKHNIKDFGNLLPGHGGIMDRFDSCLFVIPLLYSAIVIINL